MMRNKKEILLIGGVKMDDYISRDDVLKAIDYQHEVNNVFESEAAYVQMWETINDDIGIKSAHVQPVKHGYWEEEEPRVLKCSICGEYAPMNYLGQNCIDSRYCPWCGARMDGDTE